MPDSKTGAQWALKTNSEKTDLINRAPECVGEDAFWLSFTQWWAENKQHHNNNNSHVLFEQLLFEKYLNMCNPCKNTMS